MDHKCTATNPKMNKAENVPHACVFTKVLVFVDYGQFKIRIVNETSNEL